VVDRSQGADNRPRSGSTVAQLWRSKLPAIVAKHSPVDANPRHRPVAIGIVGSRPVRTIALPECGGRFGLRVVKPGSNEGCHPPSDEPSADSDRSRA
jgi:hypothetical protein